MRVRALSKGDIVTYRTDPRYHVRAIVRRCHRDGTYTVEAMHFLEGKKLRWKTVGCYIGIRCRLNRKALTLFS